MRKILLLTILSVFAFALQAQVSIAFVEFNFDNPDGFAFVSLVDIPEGTVIYFTDNGITADGSFRANEGVWSYTVPAGGLACGSVTTLSSTDVTTSGSLAFSTSGDQIIAYTGTAADPTFVAALNSEGNSWQTDATSSNTSALPPGLTDGTDAVAIPEVDNAKYNGTLTTGTAAELLAAINDPNNWTGSNSASQTYDGGAFTVLDCNPLPVELSTVSASFNEVEQLVAIEWTTLSELENDYFEVLRSFNGLGWDTIGTVQGNGTTDQQNNYIFEDKSLVDGVIYYQLKQVDFDGSFEFSEVISVVAEVTDQLQIDTANRQAISFSSSVEGEATYQVFNSMGTLVADGEFIAEKGGQSVYFGNDLAQGFYIIKLTVGAHTLSEKFIVK